jgi:hypothetical protein
VFCRTVAAMPRDRRGKNSIAKLSQIDTGTKT